RVRGLTYLATESWLAQELSRELTDRKVPCSNSTYAPRLLLSRIGDAGSISAFGHGLGEIPSVLQKSITAEPFFDTELIPRFRLQLTMRSRFIDFETLKLTTLSPVVGDASFPSAVFSHPGLANQNCRVVPSIVRLVRKSDRRTFRLVVNRSIRKSGRPPQQSHPDGLPVSIAPKNLSVNDRLRCPNGLVAFFSRLKHELPSIYAPSILSVSGAFSSLVRFRKAAATQGHFRFRLAKMDILDCFHSIEHAKLMEVFKEICDYARRYLFPAPDTEYLVHELEWFLRDALILFEGQLCRFQKGLAQGSCICTELANLYLAHADRQFAQGFPLWQSGVKITSTFCSTVLRYLDDYLCITPVDGNLSEFTKRVEANLEHYGLKLNPSKVQSNESTRIIWLGMEIQDDLTIMIPQEPPPRFCRFTGRPLSAEDCLLHLSRARLRSVAWRYAFNPSCGIRQPSLNIGELNSQTHWNSLCEQNAHRLGYRVADLVWVCVKTSPGRRELLTLPTARQLSICIIRGIRSTLGHKRLEWLRLAVKAFAQRLRPHRGELVKLLSQLRRYLHKCIKMETIRFSPRLYS
ncbi:hypothetical protein T265_14406, partial [Opisthorchis viverrini]